MALVIDRRAGHGANPGVHAFVVGVSDYPFLPAAPVGVQPHHYGIAPLTSAALGAFAFYKWLINPQTELPLPLVTCRLLLAPSALELANDPSVATVGAARPALNNFLSDAAAWRTDASSSPDSISIFYFAGHGVQRNLDDSVLLLEEFGNGIGGPLVNGVDVRNLFYGMAPSTTRPDIANTQLYFIDACRNMPEIFTNFETLQPTQIFPVELSGRDNRRAPIFHASIAGTTALGLRGRQTLFSKAVIDCLVNDAADLEEVNGQERWVISVHRLAKALDIKIADLNREFGGDQECGFGGIPKDAQICNLQATPTVDVQLEIDPDLAVSETTIEVRDEMGAPVAVPNPLAPHPYTCRWPAGMYSIGATVPIGNPYGFRPVPPRPRPVLPPRFFRRVKVN